MHPNSATKIPLACDKDYRLSAAKYGFWAIRTFQLPDSNPKLFPEIKRAAQKVYSSINWAIYLLFAITYIIVLKSNNESLWSPKSHLNAFALTLSLTVIIIGFYFSYVLFWHIIERFAWRQYHSDSNSLIDIDYVLQPKKHKLFALLAVSITIIISFIIAVTPILIMRIIR